MIEKKETSQRMRDLAQLMTPNRDDFGYIPLPTTVQGEDTGSVYAAHLRQENSIGALLTRKSSLQLSDEERKNYKFSDYIDLIPQDMITRADKYFGVRNQGDVDYITAKLRQEDTDRARLDAHPIKALAYALDPLEPTNWLPGGVIYKEAKAATGIAKSMLSVGAAGIAGAATQETILHQAQRTRTLEESMWNSVAAGIVGGVIGGGVSAFASRAIPNPLSKQAASNAPPIDVDAIRARGNIENDVFNALTGDTHLSAAKNKIMDGSEIARMRPFIQNTMKLVPMNRLLTSPLKTAQWAGSVIFEHNYTTVKNTNGITAGSSLERSIKMKLYSMNPLSIQHTDNFYAMHGITGKFKGTKKALSSITEKGGMNMEQYNRAVYEVALTGVQHENAEVNKSGMMWRKHFDDLSREARELGILPEDATLPNAPHYVMIMYNKNKIIEQGKRSRADGSFPKYLYDKFVISNEATREFQASPLYLKSNDKIKELRKLELMYPKSQLEGFEKKLKTTESKIESLKRDIKRFNKSQKPDTKSINKFKKEIKSLDEFKERIIKSMESHNSAIEKIAKEIEEIEKRILDAAPAAAKDWEGKLYRIIEGDGIESAEDLIWANVEQTVDHVLGDSDGSLVNPFLSSLSTTPRPFKPRKLIIDQLEASEWHITDIEKIADAHMRAMAPQIELQRFAKKNGFESISDFIAGVETSLKNEYDALTKTAKGKEAAKLQAQHKSNLADIKAGFEMLQGVYGQGFNVLNSSGQQFMQNILNWNYTRMLGHMTISSLPDLGTMIMRHGVFRTIADGYAGGLQTAKQTSKRDLRAIGYACNTQIATIVKQYAEHGGLSTSPSPFTKGLNSLTQAFGNLTMMNPWTDMIQNMAGHVSISRILDLVHDHVGGKSLSKKDSEFLARIGIGQEHFGTIARHTKDNVVDGTRTANWTQWDIQTPADANALRSFQEAVGRCIDEVTLVPNMGDKPLLLRQKGALGNITSMLFQFKSFMFAAQNRLFYAGIQNLNDVNFYTGAVAMVGLGMLGYICSSFLRGKDLDEIDMSSTHLIRESIDRSGVLAILGEGMNIGAKVLQIGDVSRYQSRTAFGSTFGPTGDAAYQLLQTASKLIPISENYQDWTTSDAQTLLRLMPLQNAFYLHRINRLLAKNAALELGAREND